MAKKKNQSKEESATTPRVPFIPQGHIFVSKPIEFRPSALENTFARADLQLHGLDHSGASYEGRIFLNNAEADVSTPRMEKYGYAGSFHVFGHGTCYGDVGHCEVHGERRSRDLRPSHPLTRAFKRIPITNALRHAIAGSETPVTVTIVPVIQGGDVGCDLVDVLHFERLRLVTYD